MPLATIAVLAIGLVALLVYGVVAAGDDTTLDDAVKRGDKPAAPDRTRALPRLQGGGTARLADFDGKVVVLNFWASWCEPCRAEAPILQKAHERLSKAGTGLVFGVTYNDAAPDSLGFERELGISYPSVRDVGTELAEAFGTRALPETFVLDREGRVVAVSRGQLTQRFIDDALAEAGA